MKKIITSLLGLSLTTLALGKPLERTYPSKNYMDTILYDVEESLEGDLFSDSEIVRVHTVHSGDIDSPRVNENGKFVVQQQGVEACPYGVMDMFSGDHGKYPDFPSSGGRSMSHEIVAKIMHDRGLPLMTSTITYDESRNISGLFQLKKLLNKYGSLILGILDRKLGSHFIIIDEIADNFQTVRLRDPWHGWDITVKADAIRKRISDPRVLHLPYDIQDENAEYDDQVPPTSSWKYLFPFKKKQPHYKESMFRDLEISG